MNISATFGRVWKWLRWSIYLVVFGLFLFIALGTKLAFDKDTTDAAVAAIHAQHITLADVNGVNLPPVPNQTENDATVAGIDKNNNGIRDDVELAIFKKYPGQANAKVRAAELQYAMTEQMFLTHVFDTATWKAVAEENGRAQLCSINQGADWRNVESLVFNTTLRDDARESAYKFITSYSPARGIPCDTSVK